MFEKEIKFITAFNLNKIKKLGSFFTIENAKSANVHPAVVQYISAELDYMIHLDRKRLLQKSVFDYSGTDVAKLFSKIGDEIKKQKLLPLEEVEKMVQQAVMFNVNFVLRPNWTLMKFIYDGDELRSTEELKLLLNYTYFYPYMKEIINQILDKRKAINISSYEFKELLEGLQKELVEDQIEIFLEDSLNAISDFVNVGEVGKRRIAVGTLEIFLKEKELP